MTNIKESLKKDILGQESFHLTWLRSLGFDIESLNIGGWIKCLGTGETKPSGTFAYKTWVNELRNGGLGVVTLAKVRGKDHKYETLPSKDCSEIPFFRLSSLPSLVQKKSQIEELKKHKEAARKAYGFWKHSLVAGESDYLIRKCVGSYGIRFRDNEYGKIAVVPMFDIDANLWNYQLLNPNGTKLFSKSGKTEGLFHCLAPLVDGKPFGIAESYVTAATCYELTGIPTVCAFTCHNLGAVAKALNSRYLNSPVILFADNDRHINNNQGILKAKEAYNSINGPKVLVVPDFADYEPIKSASDWNDLVKLKGKDTALVQLTNKISFE